MPTAQDITDNALSKLGVKRGGIAPSADETADAIKVMNAVLAEWQANGIHVRGSQASAAADETFVPDWAEEALAYKIGFKMAPSFDANISQVFALGMSEAMDAVIQRGVVIGEAQLPPTFPVGAGNRWGQFVSPTFFVNEGFNDITDEHGSSLQTERGCILFLDTREGCDAT